jgi:NAD(P)H dehydrogenase (quinone)
MIVVGIPYSEPAISNMEKITGGTPYGASTLTKSDGNRFPSENELKIARFQGRRVATIAKQLKAGLSALS